MKNNLTKRQKISLIVVISLLLALAAGLILVSRSQEIRKKAGGGGASSVTLGFYPAEDQIKIGETKVYELKAFFTDGSPNERLSHVKIELTFPKKDKSNQYVLLPANDYVNTSTSGFNLINRVDGPQVQNLTAKVIIDLLAKPDTGPTTDKALTIARFRLQGTNPTAISQYVTLGNIIFTSQNSVNPINTVTQELKLDVLEGACLKPIDCAAPPPDCNYQGGDGCTTCGTLVCITPFSAPTSTPSPVPSSITPPPTSTPSPVPSSITPIPSITCTPRLPCLDAVPGCKLAEPPGGWCLQNPTPTSIPSTTPIVEPSIVITPIVTPSSGRDKYVIDIGTKQWLSINIGPAVTPQIRFKAKIARVFNTPNIYVRLRVKDDLAFTTNGNGNTTDSCNNPPAGTTDYYIPMKADINGIYSPVPQIDHALTGNRKVAAVTSDGWVTLDGLSGGKYYSLYLKGPKTAGSRMAAHVILQPNQNAQVQDFDWTATPLQAGDLPDPNNNGQQDCTVNSVDMSLIQSLLGKTDQASLDVADVNYDGVVQGSDLASLVITLSSKPDDDN